MIGDFTAYHYSQSIASRGGISVTNFFPLSMDQYTHPGKGLSLSQLVFALNEELKHAAYSPSYVAKYHRQLAREALSDDTQHADFLYSFTFDDVSQLDGDVSTALANIREWRNSFIHINRIPSDVLYLIPTHLHDQTDRFNASYVCRHWRRVLLQHSTLLSRLFLSKGKVYARTLLERAKGSALDIVIDCGGPTDTITLLSPHTHQIRSLDFVSNSWKNIQRFSDVNSGPYPLLHILEICLVKDPWPADQPDPMTPPSLPLFSNAVNLEQLVLRFEKQPFLNRFVFPNLTTFESTVTPRWDGFHALELLDFLEASPTLQTVHMKIIADIFPEGVAQKGVVVLPDVQTFSLFIAGGWLAYELAARISCPFASYTSLTHWKYIAGVITDQDIRDTFLTTVLWNAIVRQCTESPVETVSLEIKTPQDSMISCTLTFQSSDATIIKFGVEVSEDIEEDVPGMSLEHKVLEVFSQASRIILDYPLLHNAKYLHILHEISFSDFFGLMHMASNVGKLFRFIGPLEVLSLHGCDLRPYLAPFLGLPEFEWMGQQITFPPIKELTISHPKMVDYEDKCMNAVVELAKSQHALGVHFERVTVRAEKLPTAMAETLGPWVSVADCCEERRAPTPVHDE